MSPLPSQERAESACGPPYPAAGRGRLHRADRRHRRVLRDADQLLGVRVLRHLLPGAARRPGRAEAGAAADPVLDAGDGGPARPQPRQVRPGGRRGDGQVPPARRRRHLRRPGPDRPAVDHAAHPGRRARQLRVPGLRSGGDALHRVPDGAGGAGHDRRSGRRHRRLQAELRRQGHRAVRAAGRLPEPAGQRRLRDRGRDGHQLRPAQPGRGGAGPAAPDQAPGRRPGHADAVHPRARSAGRRQDHRSGRDPGRVRHRQGLVPDPGHRPDRAGASAPQGHRDHRAAVPGRSGAGDRAAQDPGHHPQAAGHRRRQGPDRPGQRHPAGDRGQERLQPRGPAGAALQADQAGGLVRHQRRRPGRGPAADAVA